jgi:hypothetical protein
MRAHARMLRARARQPLSTRQPHSTAQRGGDPHPHTCVAQRVDNCVGLAGLLLVAGVRKAQLGGSGVVVVLRGKRGAVTAAGAGHRACRCRGEAERRCGHMGGWGGCTAGAAAAAAAAAVKVACAAVKARSPEAVGWGAPVCLNTPAPILPCPCPAVVPARRATLQVSVLPSPSPLLSPHHVGMWGHRCSRVSDRGHRGCRTQQISHTSSRAQQPLPHAAQRPDAHKKVANVRGFFRMCGCVTVPSGSTGF